MNLPPIEERVEKLLSAIAESKRPCNACGEQLYFVRHRETGRLAPYTKDAVNHFINCSAAAQFRRNKHAAS